MYPRLKPLGNEFFATTEMNHLHAVSPTNQYVAITLFERRTTEYRPLICIEPLADLDQPRAYDPSTDLIPLCPNCHRAIHRQTPTLSPDELRELLNP